MPTRNPGAGGWKPPSSTKPRLTEEDTGLERVQCREGREGWSLATPLLMTEATGGHGRGTMMGVVGVAAQSLSSHPPAW